jgi:hypothetical protein
VSGRTDCLKLVMKYVLNINFAFGSGIGVIGHYLRGSLRTNDQSGMTAISRDQLGEMIWIGDLCLAREIDSSTIPDVTFRDRSPRPVMSFQVIVVALKLDGHGVIYKYISELLVQYRNHIYR